MFTCCQSVLSKCVGVDVMVVCVFGCGEVWVNQWCLVLSIVNVFH